MPYSPEREFAAEDDLGTLDTCRSVCGYYPVRLEVVALSRTVRELHTGVPAVEDLRGLYGGRRKIRAERRSLLIYLGVAYAFTWLLWVPPLLGALPEGWALPSPDKYAQLAVEGFADNQHLLLAVVFSVAVYGPLLGALIATGHERGPRGGPDLLARTFNLRVLLRWYLVALIIAAGMSYPAKACWPGPPATWGQPMLDVGTRLALFVPILLLQLLTSGLGEKPGWRGYLLPRLQKRFRPVRTVWLLGLAWAVWHYPLTTIYALSGVPADAPAPAGVITVVIALLSQTIGMIGLTYVYVWLFNRTCSIFLMIVFHALTNALPFLRPAGARPVGDRRRPLFHGSSCWSCGSSPVGTSGLQASEGSAPRRHRVIQRQPALRRHQQHPNRGELLRHRRGCRGRSPRRSWCPPRHRRARRPPAKPPPSLTDRRHSPALAHGSRLTMSSTLWLRTTGRPGDGSIGPGPEVVQPAATHPPTRPTRASTSGTSRKRLKGAEPASCVVDRGSTAACSRPPGTRSAG